MNDDSNPNGMIKYCCDCVYFKKKWTLENLFFDRSEYALCTKVKYDATDSDYEKIHPKYTQTTYHRAKHERNFTCKGAWWEPKE